ncbi:hypothetical protein HOC01_04540 [archaeon]|jgi:hypothetical protein|nr:hypothetical protein [archaeon]MBT6698234.1 hypothetical protein [archaeon]
MLNDKVFKQKVAHSFDLAKRDIHALYAHIEWLSTRLAKIEEENKTLGHAIEAVKGEVDECRADCCQ